MKRWLLITSGVVAAAVLAAGSFMAYQWHLYNRTIRIDPQCTLFLDEAGNSLLLTSEDGSKALLIDTKKGREAAQLASRIHVAGLTIVNTHGHPDHTSGNDLYNNAPIIGGNVPRDIWNRETNTSRYPTDVLESGEMRTLHIGTETVTIRNTGRGHTGNDLIVYLKKRRLLATGDLLFPGIHPVLFPTSGGNTAAWVATLKTLLADTAIMQVIPGHGLPATRKALATQKDYFTEIASATDDPEKLSALRKKYRGYYAVPDLSSFDKTVRFIKREQASR